MAGEMPRVERYRPQAHCPGCDMPTVPDHEDLTYEDMLCEVCWLEVFSTDEGAEAT